MKLGTSIIEDVGSMDHSHPERVPHEESVGNDLAKARLRMPPNVSMLEQSRMHSCIKHIGAFICPRIFSLIAFKTSLQYYDK